jgi:uncharacterized protein YcbK (DUF882 family)
MPQTIITAMLALLLSFCPAIRAQSPGAKEVSASALMEQLPSMLADTPAPPEVSEAEIEEVEEGLDVYTYIFINKGLAHPPDPVNLGGDGSLTLTRQGSGETLTARYRNKDGSYNAAELDKISRLMRCTLTGKTVKVSAKLVELLDAVEDHFGKRGLILLSGYRTPKFNGQVSGAARYSLHMLGWAADIRIPGGSSAKLARYARKLRAGGVGYYPSMGFTHLDVGNYRYWTVKRPARRPAARR